jgi:beta-glucanase (GH16 family)
VNGGKLAIEARREDREGRHYTSARIKTAGLMERTYGRYEARIRIPRGQGIWPAFWLLGADCATTGWPRCGEIDIMENIGKEPGIVHGTLHGPGFSGDQAFGAPSSLAPAPTPTISTCMRSSGSRARSAGTATASSTTRRVPTW